MMEFFANCIAGNYEEVFRTMKDTDLSNKIIDMGIECAFEKGKMEIVDLLLQSAVGPSCFGIGSAAYNGQLALVDKILQEKRVDPSFRKNYAIRMAAQYGHLDVLERLLQDRRVDPSAEDNYAIRLAACWGHLAVVERLMQDKRVDPSARGNLAVRLAAQNGHLAIVERLLQDKRVDPSAGFNHAVRGAAQNGHLAVVERILQDKRVDPSAYNNLAVRSAASRGHLAVVDILLEDNRTSFSEILESCLPEEKKYFEYRNRFTEICIALQNLNLPAWITMLIIRASYPWNILPIHKQWSLVCTVKHFHDRFLTEHQE
jgi:surface antigen